jgi:hypothetical protein
MGKDDDEKEKGYDRPAETPDDWKAIWRSVERSSNMWWLVGPVHAVASNWKAIALVVAAVAWLSRDDIRAAIAVLAGTGQ